MIVRGAPAIGVAAGMGIALGVRDVESSDAGRARARVRADLQGHRRDPSDGGQPVLGDPAHAGQVCAIARQAGRARSSARSLTKPSACTSKTLPPMKLWASTARCCCPRSGGVLTHCNAGALATAGYGTALGVIRAAVESGKKLHVFADETRPFLQGSRLTAWELMKDNIPTTLISDNMAGAIMRQGKINAVVVGADRIAANGDVANKIGTYTVAILAKEHGIPFYVAAPTSTVDLETPDGSKIPIEQRASTEVTHLAGKQIAPDGVGVENPAFDVTPHEYVSAIITERGVARAPYSESLKALVGIERAQSKVTAEPALGSLSYCGGLLVRGIQLLLILLLLLLHPLKFLQ